MREARAPVTLPVRSSVSVTAPGQPKYGLFCYRNTMNLGDEIQSLAAQQFLPQVDQLLDREMMNSYRGPALRMILNGWYMHQPWNWPPSGRIDPLLISMHISQEIAGQNSRAEAPDVAMLRGRGLSYLRARGPVGARDRIFLWLHDAHLSGVSRRAHG
jgi:hypothetical protein